MQHKCTARLENLFQLFALVPSSDSLRPSCDPPLPSGGRQCAMVKPVDAPEKVSPGCSHHYDTAHAASRKHSASAEQVHYSISREDDGVYSGSRGPCGQGNFTIRNGHGK